MLISKILEKANQCISVSQSVHLSNIEEQQTTLMLAKYLNQLSKLVLSNHDNQMYKKKISVIQSPYHLNYLKNIIDSETFPFFYWNKLLSLKTNFLIHAVRKNRALVYKLIFNDLRKIFSKKYTTLPNNAFHYAEGPDAILFDDTQRYCLKLIKTISSYRIRHVIVPSRCIFLDRAWPKFLDGILTHIQGTLVIDITNPDHFHPCFNYLQKKMDKHPTIKFGISLHTNIKQTIPLIDHICSQLHSNHKHRFILRITKGVHWYRKEQTYSPSTKKLAYYRQYQLKTNTYFKWSIFTIMNYVRKHHIRCHIQSNNLFDIAWILILRAQQNLESKIKFETDINSFPNIAKVLYLFPDTSIQMRMHFLDDVKNNITILLTKLIKQGSLYTIINGYHLKHDRLFIKSHNRFFKYLQRNFLNILLKKTSTPLLTLEK